MQDNPRLKNLTLLFSALEVDRGENIRYNVGIGLIPEIFL